MAKRKEHFLLKINAIIVAVLGMMGCHSCSYYVKYGVPDFPGNDTMFVDTLVHCMYGVMPIEKYGVPGGEWAPQRDREEVPETPKDSENK